MHLLVCVAHYYNAEGGGAHGSLSPDSAPRIAALRQLILQLHRLFGEPAGVLNHLHRRIDQAGDGGGSIEIKICTTAENHLLHHLDDLRDHFEQVICQPSHPKLLGFECHRILRESSQQNIDYYGYMEDDLLITDADFFSKLRHFNRVFGNTYLLQPNRIETSEDLKRLRRFYIDGDYHPPAAEQWRQSMQTELALEHLGSVVKFRQPLNLHSGCFFLNSTQAHQYFASESSRAQDTSYHGPLESAASLGVMKTFQIMKPATENGQFLTIEHAGRNFMGLIQ